MKKNKGMQGKFISVFFGITTVLFFIIFAIFTKLIFETEEQKYMESAVKRVETVTGSLNRVLNAVLDRSAAISESLLLQEILMVEESQSDYLEEYMFLKKFFHGYQEYENYSDGQYCIYPTNRKIPENAYVTKLDRLEKSDIWSKIKDIGKEEIVWIFLENQDESYFSVFKRITYGVNVDLGFLEIKIPLRQIEEILSSAETERGETVRLTSQDGTVIYESESGLAADRDILLSEKLVSGHELTVAVELKHIYSNGYIYLFTAFVFMILLLFGCYILYYFITNRLMRPFSNFVRSIENDEQVLLNPELIEDEDDRDVLKIVVKFKEMAQKINRMYQDIEIINKEKKKAEFEVLQSSINPHLLYNSLSVLKWRLSDTGDTEMMNLIDFMVEYYRSALSDGRIIITVEEEMRLVKSYLQIVKIAYNKDFDLSVNVSEEVSECLILKQILQPIVENAVMHGLKKKEEARLEISARKSGEKIVFEVVDNGYGMEKEQVDRILNDKSDSISKKHSGYGLRNISGRIRTYYGNEAGISIESEKGQGTKVTMTIGNIEKNQI